MQKKASRQIGLFFGSFNPIHHGHLMLANYIFTFGRLDELWFVVSPQNPLKMEDELLAQEHRLQMVKLAIENQPGFKAVDVEFHLPKPSYTIHTLQRLNEMYPKYGFSIIVGADSLAQFHQWKDHEIILRDYPIIVYPRKDYSLKMKDIHSKVQLIDAPTIEVSSTFIRRAIQQHKAVPFFLPQQVYAYILNRNLYHQ